MARCGSGRAGLLLAPRSILSSVICYLSSASRRISVAHCKELFKPSSPRIVCRELEMHQIRYFLAVSEYLNFRHAAEECHVSALAPPGLSRNPKTNDGTAEKLNELLRNGWLDLAILAQPQPFPDTFQTSPLYRERFCVAFPVGHEFQARQRSKMDDAAKKPQLLPAICAAAGHLQSRPALGRYQRIGGPMLACKKALGGNSCIKIMKRPCCRESPMN